METRGFSLRRLLAALAAAAVMNTAPARADDDLRQAISQTKPILDLRIRYEDVDQAPFADRAKGLTLRTRAGFETGKAWQTSLLVEADWLLPMIDTYNSTINGKTNYPSISDPKGFEIKQLKLTNTAIPSTTVMLGRQRMEIEDQRFIGSSNWRQNGQTFDALRVVNTSVAGLTVDAGYIDRANRVYGPDSPQGHYTGDSFYGDAAYATPLGTVTGFAYLLQFDPLPGFAPQRDSSQTYSARFFGGHAWDALRVSYAASFAKQRSYRNNPLTYSADYYFLDLGAAAGGFSGGASYEVLGGTGTKGFTTPIATLHKFQGWADKFTATPANGVADLYGTVGYTQKNLGPFSTVAATLVYHRFDAAHISMHYGNEVDWQLQGKWRKFTLTFEYADYRADRLMTDTRKLWLQIEYIL